MVVFIYFFSILFSECFPSPFCENCYPEPNNINPFLRMIDCNYWCRYLQGDPNQNFKCVLAITQKLCISDPMLVKPKCVWEAAVFSNFRKFVYIFQLFVYNFSKKLPPLKRILALPTWGQKSLISELQPFEKGNFDLGHPVPILFEIRFSKSIGF